MNTTVFVVVIIILMFQAGLAALLWALAYQLGCNAGYVRAVTDQEAK